MVNAVIHLNLNKADNTELWGFWELSLSKRCLAVQRWDKTESFLGQYRQNAREESLSCKLMVSGIETAESKGRAGWCWTEHFILKNTQIQCDIQSAKTGWFKIRNHSQTQKQIHRKHTTWQITEETIFSTYQESQILWVFLNLFLILRPKTRVTASLFEDAHNPSKLLSIT